MTKVYGSSVAQRWTARLMCGAAGAVLLTGAAHAQTAAPAPATADAGGIGVVTVTAERRAENLQKVPISATVKTGAALKSEGVYGLQSLQNQAPGVSIQPPTSSETYINIRGVGIQFTAPNSSNGVAFYVDGMYVPSLIDTVNSFYDLQNVEVLRGPQGTLAGANSDGGAIFINSAQPSFDRVKGYIQQSIGNYNDYRTEGGINMPINDMVAARLGFVFETRDSFTKNVGAQTGAPGGGFTTPAYAATYPAAQDQPGDVNFEAARLQVAFKPSDKVELTVRFEPYESRSSGPVGKPDEAAIPDVVNYYNTVYQGVYGKAIPASLFQDPWAQAHENDPFLVDYDSPTYFDIEGQRTSATLIWHITPDVELRDVFAYQSGYEKDAGDQDASSAALGATLVREADFASYSEEVNLLSTGSGPLQWVVGGYYSHLQRPLTLTFGDGPQVANPSNCGPTAVQPDLGEFCGAAIFADATNIDYSVFGSITYAFSPEWSLTVGGRYSYDQAPFVFDLAPGILPNVTAPYTDSEPTGTVKINFQATPSTLIYGSVSTGYKTGGINPYPITPSVFLPGGVPFTVQPFNPETNLVGELGLKTDFLDHHLRFDGDFYYSVYQNFQVQETLLQATPGNGLAGAPYQQNIGNANIWGFEGELTGVFGDFQFNLGVAYMNAEVAKTFNLLGPLGNSIAIKAGSETPYSPPWTITAGAQYGFHVWGGLLTPRIQYQFQDTQYPTLLHYASGADSALSEGEVIPAHGTADLFLTYAAPEHWQVQGYVTNFTNAVYKANVLPNVSPGGVPLFVYGNPIQYGVRLTYNF